VAVKTVLFRSYCICLYDAALWSNFHVGMLNKLRSCYNGCIKIFFGYSLRDSLTNILFNLGLPSFDTVMTNAAVTFARFGLVLIVQLCICVSSLCSLSNIYFSQYSFPSVCLSMFFMFVCAFMSLLLSGVYGPCCLNEMND